MTKHLSPRYFVEDHFDYISVVAGVVQTVLYADFFYLYISRGMCCARLLEVLVVLVVQKASLRQQFFWPDSQCQAKANAFSRSILITHSPSPSASVLKGKKLQLPA